MQQHLVANGAGVAIIDRLSTLPAGSAAFVWRPIEPTRWVTFGAIRNRDAEADPLVEAMLAEIGGRLAECVTPGSIEILPAHE